MAQGRPSTARQSSDAQRRTEEAAKQRQVAMLQQFDAVRRAELEQAFNLRVQSVAAEMRRLGYPVRIISRRRTAEEQARLFEIGRTKPGRDVSPSRPMGRIVTEASGTPGRESLHQSGLAVDFAFTGRGKPPWEVLGQVAKEHGLEWGGDWKAEQPGDLGADMPHVQRRRPSTVSFPRGGTAAGVTDPRSARVTPTPEGGLLTRVLEAVTPSRRPSEVQAAGALEPTRTPSPAPPTGPAAPPPTLSPVVSAKTGGRRPLPPLAQVPPPSTTPPSAGPTPPLVSPRTGVPSGTLAEVTNRALAPLAQVPPTGQGTGPRPPIVSPRTGVPSGVLAEVTGRALPTGPTAPRPPVRATGPAPDLTLPPVVSAKTGARAERPRPPVMQAEGVTDPASVRMTVTPGGEQPVSWPDIIAGIARDEGVNPALAVAIAERENEPFDPSALSEAGAIGLMQVKPETAQIHGQDPNDPIGNIRAGVLELKRLTDKYGDDLDAALAAYNAGEGAVEAAGGVPDNPAVQGYLYGDNRPGVYERLEKYAHYADEPKPATEEPPRQPQPKIGAAPSPWWDVSRVTLPATGAALGGYYGFQASLPVAAATANPWGAAAVVTVGSLAGAGAGAFGFESIQIALETLAQKLGIGNTGLQPITPSGVVRRQASAAYTGMEQEAAGRVLAGGAQKAMQPFREGLQPWAPYARELLGEKVPPAQLSKSRTLGMLHNIAQEGFWGGEALEDVATANQTKAEAAVLEVLETLGAKPSAQQAGRAVQERLPVSAVAEAEAAVAQTKREVALRQAEREALVSQGAARATVQGAERAERLARAEALVAEQQAAQARELATRQQAGEQLITEAETALGGPVAPRAAGEAALTTRLGAVKQSELEQTAAWNAFNRLGDDIVVVETPKLNALVAGVTGRSRGAILPNAGLTAARRALDLFEPIQEEGAEELTRQLTSGAVTPAETASLQRALAKALEEGAQEAPPPLTATQMAQTVSELRILAEDLKRAAKANPSKYRRQAGLAARVHQVAREELTDLLGKADTSEARQAYEAATAMTREASRQFFNKNVRGVANRDPDKLVGTLLKKDQATVVDQVTAAVGEGGMRPVRAAGLNRVVARDPKTGAFDPAKTVANMNRIGNETLDALLPGGEHRRLRQVAEAIFEAERIGTDAQEVDKLAVKMMRDGVAQGNAADKAAMAAIEARVAQGQAADEALVQAARERLAQTRPDLLEPLRTEARSARVIGKLFQKDNAEMIQAVHLAVGDEAFQPMQRLALDRLLRRHRRTGDIDWDHFARRFDGLDPQTRRAMFPGGQDKDIRTIAQTMMDLQHSAAGARGRMVVQMTEAGIIVGLMAGGVPAGAAGIVVSPFLLSKLMASPFGSKWLAEGFRAKPRSQEAIRAVTQLVGFLQRDIAAEQVTATASPQDIELPAPAGP